MAAGGNQFFGGDEVGAMVLDMGSTTTRCGFAGEDCPKLVYPSYVGICGDMPVPRPTTAPNKAGGKKPGLATKLIYNPPDKLGYTAEQLSLRKREMRLIPAMSDGLVSNWGAVDQLWRHGLVDGLRVDVREHPLLLTEPTHNTPAIRERMLQMIFESQMPPAVYIAKNSVLSSFAYGRPTSVVLKSGGQITSATSIYEGHALLTSNTRSTFTGRKLDEILLSTLRERGIATRPRTSIIKRESAPGSCHYEIEDLDLNSFAPSWRDYWLNDLATDMKKSCCLTSLYPHLIPDSQESLSYTLPDGNTVALGADMMYGLAENLFTQKDSGRLPPPGGGPPAVAPGYQSSVSGRLMPSVVAASKAAAMTVTDMVVHAIEKTDIDVKKDLYANICVTGGNTLLPGFNQRLNMELSKVCPQGLKVKVHMPRSTTEQHHSAWVGGSILASLGTFHQLWISKEQYKEYGPALVHRSFNT